MLRYVTAHIWERGQRRQNEDAIAIFSILYGNQPFILAIVADGVGGMEAGEIASGEVTRRVKAAFEELFVTKKNSSLWHIRNHILKELFSCHKLLLEYGRANEMSLGTTCSLIFLRGRKGVILHVGDSRIYKRKSGKLRLLTKDDVDESGKLVRCIGAGSYKGVYKRMVRLRKKEELLLCTDGYYKNNGDNRSAIWIKRSE